MKSRTWMWMTAVYLFAALAMPVGMAAQDIPSRQHKPKHHQYKLIDMGTFGGPASYASSGGSGTPFLNNRGMLTGSADTSTPDPYAPNCFNPDCFVSHTFRWKDGILTDLGALPGVNSSEANGMNALGWIAGASENGAIDPLTQFPESRAVLWSDDQTIDLGTLGGGYESTATEVNTYGQVTGFAQNLISDPFFGTQVRVFLWEKGAMRDLGTLGGPDCPPFGNTSINEDGQVAGSCFTSSTVNQNTGIPTLDPFLWERGRMVDLGTLGGTIGSPYDLNNRGQVVGQSNLAGDLTFHPFLWSREVLTDLGTLGGDNGQPNRINDGGDVVGKADLPGSQTHDGFVWQHGLMTDLGTLRGDPCSNANWINEQRQIVGNSSDCVHPLHAFLWEEGGPMVDLNSLIPANSSLKLTNAEDINERGEIAGVGVPPGCQPSDVGICGHAYLLIPCDEKHLGECEDYSMIEVATLPQTSSFKAELPATIKQSGESPADRVNQFRNQLIRRHYIPGQPLAQHD